MNLRRQINVNSIKMCNPAYSRNLVITCWQISRQLTGKHTILTNFQINKAKFC
ncbi:hypothetical protein EVA_16674 [gut metagenome]|uniref:Uncharacterized protein n=1 Tax=gut metagenome TaxID=749906 RepID=J9G6U6_9ZZZZ